MDTYVAPGGMPFDSVGGEPALEPSPGTRPHGPSTMMTAAPHPGLVTRRGQRLFVAASVALLVVAGLHTAGHFTSAPADPAGESVINTMRNYRVDAGLGQQPNLFAIQQSLSLAMTILLAGLAFINLSIVAIAGDVPGVLRRLTMLSLLIVGGLVVLFGWYRITPPFVTLFAVELMLVASLIVQRGADDGTIRTTEASSPST